MDMKIEERLTTIIHLMTPIKIAIEMGEKCVKSFQFSDPTF